MKHSKKILIIGNGPAGNEAASIIRKHSNIAISIFSKEPYPEYSACFLHDFISDKLERKQLFLKNHEDYASNAINAVLGKSVYEINTDTKCVTCEGGRERYDKLIIAMGSDPILPNINGVGLKGVFTFKSLRDAENIAAFECKAVAVVGAGPIGIEISIALKGKGIDVYLIEKDKWILPRIFGERLANELEIKVKSNGIVVLTGEEVTRILGDDGVKGIVLESGNTIDCDMVIFSIGMKPNTEIAKNAGLKVGILGGIITDENMLTSSPEIYACGDCVESKDTLTNKSVLNALWPNAVIEGKVAGLNAIGLERKCCNPININCIQIYDLTAVSVGYSDFSLSGLGAKDVIEGSALTGEYRIILFNGTVVGMQIIARDNNLVPLFNLIYKQQELSTIKKAIVSNEFFRRNPLSVSLLLGKNINILKKLQGGY